MEKDFNLKEERKNLFKWLSEQLGKSNAILICGKIMSQDKEFIKKDEDLIHLLLNGMITKDEFWHKRDKLSGGL